MRMSGCNMKYFIALLAAVCALAQSQQVVNVGTTANDGTGDTARAAFIKANTNFTALFTQAFTNTTAYSRTLFTNSSLGGWQSALGVGVAGDIAIVAGITGLTNYAGTGTRVAVTDTNRGGLFAYTTDALTADGGVVFAATGVGSGFWRRQVDTPLNVKWFCAVGDGVTEIGRASCRERV